MSRPHTRPERRGRLHLPRRAGAVLTCHLGAPRRLARRTSAARSAGRFEFGAGGGRPTGGVGVAGGTAGVAWAGEANGLAHRGRLLEDELDARSGGRAQCLLGGVVEAVDLQTAAGGREGHVCAPAIRQEHMLAVQTADTRGLYGSCVREGSTQGPGYGPGKVKPNARNARDRKGNE